jgi:HEAT repeat protein
MNTGSGNVIAALGAADASTRLKAALALGSNPDPAALHALLERCAVEPDFYVRDMLTWALIRLPPALTMPGLLAQLHSAVAQARSQALHTLSKIKDGAAWPSITPSLLRDPDDEVARSAWRAAVILAPDADRAYLADELASQLGRGNVQLQRSLSRALVALGKDLAQRVLDRARESNDARIRAHAEATQRILDDPDSGFAVNEARRAFVLHKKR